MKNAQISLQFLMAISFMLVIFLSLFIAFISYNQDSIQSKNSVFLRDVAYWLKEEINIAITVEDGYKRTIELPDTINSYNYSVSKNGDYIVLISEDEDFSVKLPPFDGEFQKGTNTIKKINGNITITNS